MRHYFHIGVCCLERFWHGRSSKKAGRYRSLKIAVKNPLVVDAGCGTGALADILATYYDVIGIDISEEMLDQALKNYPDKGILWVCQDISKMEVGRPAAPYLRRRIRSIILQISIS